MRELPCPPAMTQEPGSPSACPSPSPITSPVGVRLFQPWEGKGGGVLSSPAAKRVHWSGLRPPWHCEPWPLYTETPRDAAPSLPQRWALVPSSASMAEV